jgi:hypothetical protein
VQFLCENRANVLDSGNSPDIMYLLRMFSRSHPAPETTQQLMPCLICIYSTGVPSLGPGCQSTPHSWYLRPYLRCLRPHLGCLKQSTPSRVARGWPDYCVVSADLSRRLHFPMLGTRSFDHMMLDARPSPCFVRIS